MPTYSYKCLNCDGVIEIFQSMNDSPFKRLKCANCDQKNDVKRIIIGGSGMIFKGSGFYLTDYTNYGKKKKDKNTNTEKVNKEKKTKKVED